MTGIDVLKAPSVHMTTKRRNDARSSNHHVELAGRHAEMKAEIAGRLQEFRSWGKRSDKEIFAELCFCLLTPQTRARVCDRAINSLRENGTLYKGSPEEVCAHLKGVRFSPGKSRYIVEARKEFLQNGRWTLKERLEGFKDPFEAREWLAENLLGLGYKEAGHFLRNIGKGEDLAILDRHILKNLHRHGVIEKVPGSLSRKEYMRIEALMRVFSRRIGIPMAHLDILFWSMETGEIFK